MPVAVAAGAALGPRIAAASPSTRAGQVAVGIPTGAALGSAEGSVYQYGEDRNALRGAVTGAALGGVAGGAAPYVGAGLQRLGEWIKRTDVSQIAKEMGVSVEAATVIRNAFRTADPEQARASIDAAGEGAMLADAGQGAQELLDAATTAGGQAGTIARQAVDERVSQSNSAITEALDNALGPPVGQNAAFKDIGEGTSAERSRLYAEAYAQPIDYSGSNGRFVENLLPRVPQSAINHANELLGIDGSQSKQILAKVGEDGKVEYLRMPDVEQIHYILQGLDQAIDGAKNRFGRATPKSTKLSNLRGQLSAAIKRENPTFANAQNVAADTIRSRNALDFGRDILKSSTTREDVRDALSGFSSDAERAAVRTGLRSAIDDQIANVQRTITDGNTDAREAMKLIKDFSSRANREKITQLLGRDAKPLLEVLERETIALELRAAIAANSKTAIRQSIQQGVKDQIEPSMLQTLMQGEPINATKRTVQALTGETAEAQTLREMGLFEEIASVLTQTRGAGAKRMLNVIQAAIEGQPIKDKDAALIARVLTASGALSAGPAANRQIAN